MAHVAVLDRLLTESVTALIAEGVVSLAEIAVDGTKVRANASRSRSSAAASLIGSKLPWSSGLRRSRQRSKATRRHLRAASGSRRSVGAGGEGTRRTGAGRARAMRAEKAKRAKTHAKDEAKKSELKVSLSDPEARCMRFPDGAIRPAYNAQIAVAPRPGIIVAVEMTDRATMPAWRCRWWISW